MDELKHITVVAGLIYKEDKYLIGRRKPDDLGGGYWEFPGGKLEDGEEVENCLRRELFEEIGVIAKRYSFFDSYDFKYPTKIYNLHFYLVHHFDGEITMNVHDKIEWVSFNELKNYNLLPGDIPLLEKLYKKHKE